MIVDFIYFFLYLYYLILLGFLVLHFIFYAFYYFRSNRRLVLLHEPFCRYLKIFWWLAFDHLMRRCFGSSSWAWWITWCVFRVNWAWCGLGSNMMGWPMGHGLWTWSIQFDPPYKLDQIWAVGCEGKNEHLGGGEVSGGRANRRLPGQCVTQVAWYHAGTRVQT